MALLGYARVSTQQQDLQLQIDALISAGVKGHTDYLFTDKASGKNDDREGLKLLLLKAREGDTILVTKLDRLGRNTYDMIRIIEELDSRGIAVKFLHDGISTEGSMGKMVVTILAAVAQAERDRILERTQEGRKAAIERGVKMGRKPTVSQELKQQVKQAVEQGIPKAKVAKQYKISRQKVYDILEELAETA
ncbi:recombinase family protein [Endozoicomonas sp. SM1973]|uniref:Recombinase family protein n=1 Tax=Spartinivicinus marinus TaxID=2994442 RepID=A0A853IKX7_9GAMM|nr:recombinase family protein [Spartinivicinus marinus]MCX4026433.1 recombinase family protein [Spartinivicinus marinus]NYZ69725.1 recombinase family protein [Spartinivicinus marinus]